MAADEKPASGRRYESLRVILLRKGLERRQIIPQRDAALEAETVTNWSAGGRPERNWDCQNTNIPLLLLVYLRNDKYDMANIYIYIYIS